MTKKDWTRVLLLAIGFPLGIGVLTRYGWLWFAGYLMSYTGLLSYFSKKTQ